MIGKLVAQIDILASEGKTVWASTRTLISTCTDQPRTDLGGRGAIPSSGRPHHHDISKHADAEEREEHPLILAGLSIAERIRLGKMFTGAYAGAGGPGPPSPEDVID